LEDIKTVEKNVNICIKHCNTCKHFANVKIKTLNKYSNIFHGILHRCNIRYIKLKTNKNQNANFRIV